MLLCRRFLSVVPVVIAASTWTGCGSSTEPPATGSVANDFTLPNQDGNATTLTKYRGKWVVLYFYPTDFTESGIRHARQFQRDLEKYKQVNTAVLGISGNRVSTHKDFATDEQLQTTLLSDVDLAVSKQWGSTMRNHMMQQFSARNTFIVDPNGQVAQVFLNVDTRTNSEDVLRTLEKLQAQSTRVAGSPVEAVRK